MEQTKIDSLKELSHHLPVILNNLSASPQLALTAATDPVQAIESLGFQLTDGLRDQLQNLLRFPQERIDHLQSLSNALAGLGPFPADQQTKTELHRKLYREWQEAFAGTQLPGRGANPRRQEKTPHLLSEGKEDVSCLETTSPQLSDVRLYRHLRNGEIPSQSRERENGAKKQQ